MYNTYARVFGDESDEDEASVARLLRDTAGPRQPAVAPDVLTSTGAARGRTQQAVQQRRGVGRGDNMPGTTVVTASTSVATTSTSMGNLIDFGDDLDMRARNAPAGPSGRASKDKQRGRGQPPPQVELATLSPSDPFDFFNQQPAAQSRGLPGGPSGGTQQQPPPPQQQPQHPLDVLFGPEPPDTRAGAASTASVGAALPALGSFSDLLLPFTGGPTGQRAATTSGTATGTATAAAVAAGSGPSASGSSGPWGSFSGAGGANSHPQAHHPSLPPHHPMLRHHSHSQSTNGIDDLLMEQRLRREAAAAAPGSTLGSSYKAPDIALTDRGGGGGNGGGGAATAAAAADVFDPFGGASDTAGGAVTSGRSASGTGDGASTSAAANGDGAGGTGFQIGSGGGEGFTMNQRELLLYAIPLFKDRLVFLPIVNWQDRADTSTVLGKVNAGVDKMQTSLSHMWHSLKDKGEFSAKIYKAGQAVLENMNAEERLMRNIPRKANKLVVNHPATIPPDEVQDQLTQLTSTFCYKSVGKAAVAGVMLPVAVGLEVLAVPGIGWYTAYQLFKSTSAAAGGSRLNTYLKSEKSEVRVCYAPSTKMDIYILKSRINPDGVLGAEDIEDLCHDIREPSLVHPLTELRSRFLKKTQTTKADYALLPMSVPDMEEQYGGGGPKKKD